MSRVTIPADRFPFHRHRTLAEVALYESYIARMQAGNNPLSPQEGARYGVLRRKAERHNPPPAPPEAA